jgi:GT2 family glycosyltransferase
MKISVVVVTWNGLHVLRECVAGLVAQTVDHELVVVDNGSRDGTLAWLRAYAPHVKLVALPTNAGFAGGNNIGMQAATGDYLVLLNNDTIPAPDFLEQIAAPLDADPQLGSIAGVLLFAHRPNIVAAAGIAVGRDAVHRDRWMLQPVDHLPASPTEVFGASGGAVCYRRAALREVGLFDTGYFAYLEDADLAWRLQLRGWRCVVAPAARVRHVYSATSIQGSPFKQRLLARNRWRVIVRCWPWTVLRAHWRAIVRYDLLALAYAAVGWHPATITGRMLVLRQLPALLLQRRAIQQQRAATNAELERWLGPPATVGDMLHEQQALAKIVGTAAVHRQD